MSCTYSFIAFQSMELVEAEAICSGAPTSSHVDVDLSPDVFSFGSDGDESLTSIVSLLNSNGTCSHSEF
jgi:hypothetical protein